VKETGRRETNGSTDKIMSMRELV